MSAGPEQRQADEDCSDADDDGRKDVGGGLAVGVAFDQHGRIEAEGGEGGEAAEDPGREEQPHVLAHAGAIGEIARQQPHREGSGQVDEQGPERKAVAEQSRRADVRAVAQGSADSGAQEDDQIQQRLGKMVGVARIELATPAMSTRAASANLLIFRCSA